MQREEPFLGQKIAILDFLLVPECYISDMSVKPVLGCLAQTSLYTKKKGLFFQSGTL